MKEEDIKIYCKENPAFVLDLFNEFIDNNTGHEELTGLGVHKNVRYDYNANTDYSCSTVEKIYKIAFLEQIVYDYCVENCTGINKVGSFAKLLANNFQKIFKVEKWYNIIKSFSTYNRLQWVKVSIKSCNDVINEDIHVNITIQENCIAAIENREYGGFSVNVVFLNCN